MPKMEEAGDNIIALTARGGQATLAYTIHIIALQTTSNHHVFVPHTQAIKLQTQGSGENAGICASGNYK